MATLMEKTFRIQLTEKEIRTLRNLLAEQYHCDRRNIRYDKERVKHGEPESRFYTVSEQEKHLKETAKLLKKLSRHVDEKWFIR